MMSLPLFIFCNVLLRSDVMEEYQQEMKKLSHRLSGLMFKSLGLNPEDISWFRTINHPQHHQAVLQLNSYPVCPDPSRAVGLPPHTDSSLLTVLHQSNVTGLQVLGVGGIGWVPVHPVEGALVVNVGDLMHIISNGRFKSAQHRALVNNTRHRTSIAYFFGPPRDVKISPLMKLIDLDHPKIYQPVTWKEYLDIKATHFDKALELIQYDAFSGME